jgi:hypothetical protein
VQRSRIQFVLIAATVGALVGVLVALTLTRNAYAIGLASGAIGVVGAVVIVSIARNAR